MLSFISMAGSRAVDDYAMKTCRIPGIQLMENAGRAVVREVIDRGLMSPESNILILAGKGNNGGDGYVIAQDLLSQGYQVQILSVVARDQVQGDAAHHLRELLKLKPEIQVWAGHEDQKDLITKADVIFDALLGTGVKGSIRPPYDEIISICNLAPGRIVAVDIPSGVTGDHGQILSPCIKAELTISMGFGKQGCLFEPARSQCGDILTVDIGFPEESLSQLNEQVLQRTSQADFPVTHYVREPDAHKYNSGKVLVIAGSRGYSGAAILAASAALRSGAGLVKLAVPNSIGSIAEAASLETIVSYLPETETRGLAYAAYAELFEAGSWADVVAMGPGLGRNTETLKLVNELVLKIDTPLILDADALFAVAQDPSILKQRKAATILTPHLGEFRRLAKLSSEITPRWENALAFAKTYQVYVLLKGAPSLVATPAGQVFINSSGYAGMATAGSGDVLTGIIAALWSQWDELPEILNFANFIHGRAAQHQRPEKGVLGLIAGDIVEALPRALKEYGGLPT